MQSSIELQAQNYQLANELASASRILEKKDEQIMYCREDLISLNDQILEIAAKKAEIDNVMETNKELQGYDENIIGISITSGPKAGFEEIDRSCQRKLLKQIKSRAECALWFMKAFGLEIANIRVCDGKGQNHSMNYKDRDQISSEEKEKLKKVLHLLDRFYISDAFLHELTLISDNLPKSHLIKQLRSDMNTLCHIQRTSGKPEGVEIDVVQELKFAIMSLQLKNPDCKNVTVKFCGDGTSVVMNTGISLMSFSVWFTDSNVSTSACHHTVAVVKGQEVMSFTKLHLRMSSCP